MRSTPNRLLLCGALAAAGATAPGGMLRAQDSSRAAAPTRFVLAGAERTLPLVFVREYPFVEGEVNGVRGKFMLDTGIERALTLNDHRVPLEGGRKVGTGFFGSGQTYDVWLRPRVDRVALAGGGAAGAGLTFTALTQVRSQDARMLEGITPDFLGWVGFEFWRGYAMKLDYERRQATFYREAGADSGAAPRVGAPPQDARPQDALRGEQVVGAVRFETPKLPNHPVVRVRLGSLSLAGAFDTGQYGVLYVDEATRDSLVREGTLRPEPGGTGYTLTHLSIDGQAVQPIPHVRIAHGPNPAAAPIGLPPENVTFGYGLLRQYKTVWDFRGHVIYLLRP